ncbi:hypothetical protein FJW01_01065 [Pantoea deleyi]|uniref:Uncharacterized protein n=1 Tax=Pantoea deleyi TaxID=470932 RepID=A0A506QRT3_9GAMM|nr:hypothetical protein FJW01_01065 [Pantoea deleyi]
MRARHFIPAGFRPQDGKRQKRRSEATSLSLTDEMPPVGAASDENIRAGNLPTGSRCGHR